MTGLIRAKGCCHRMLKVGLFTCFTCNFPDERLKESAGSQRLAPGRLHDVYYVP